MKTSLAIVLVLSLLGLSNVSAQNSNSNILGSLLVGGLAGWGINNVIQRNRRQDAINDAILARSVGIPDPRFGVGLSGGFGRPAFGHQRQFGYGRSHDCKFISLFPKTTKTFLNKLFSSQILQHHFSKTNMID